MEKGTAQAGVHKQHMEMVLKDASEGPTVAILLPPPGVEETCLSGDGEKATWIVYSPGYGIRYDMMFQTPEYYCEGCKDATMAWIEDYS